MNPIPYLKEIVTDPVELASITLPSAALLAVANAYREQIHSDLRSLPDLGSGLGFVIFLVVALVLSAVIKWLSHHLLNWTYNKIAQPLKLREKDTWFERANNAGLLTKDPKSSKFEDALRQLDQLKHPVLSQITLLQVQSKLARSLALMFIIFTAVVGIYSLIWAIFLLLSGLFVWKIFCDFRWEASEKAYGALYQALVKA